MSVKVLLVLAAAVWLWAGWYLMFRCTTIFTGLLGGHSMLHRDLAKAQNREPDGSPHAVFVLLGFPLWPIEALVLAVKRRIWMKRFEDYFVRQRWVKKT